MVLAKAAAGREARAPQVRFPSPHAHERERRLKGRSRGGKGVRFRLKYGGAAMHAPARPAGPVERGGGR